MSGQILILAVLLVLSAFFSSSETALFSISSIKAKHLAKGGFVTYRLIKRMKDDPHKLLTTILVGNNLVNVGASAMATAVTMHYFSNNAVGIATGIMTFLILIFGEIIPKSIATNNNILIARIVIFPLYWLSILFMPIIKFLNFIPTLTGKVHKTPIATEEELRTMVEVVEEEGEIKNEERRLIENIFRFDDTSASAIMTPNADMFVIEIDTKLNVEEIIDSGYTRIPVIEGDRDSIVGILNIKDLFKFQCTALENLSISEIMRQPYFIPENKKLDSLLQQFKSTQEHIAIVVDEHGKVAGLITLEDVLESLVGEIVDETDRETSQIIKIRDKEWLVLGKTHIEEVNENIGMEIKASRDYETFSGFILEAMGRIPNEKEKIHVDGFEVTVKERTENRITAFFVRQKS